MAISIIILFPEDCVAVLLLSLKGLDTRAISLNYNMHVYLNYLGDPGQNYITRYTFIYGPLPIVWYYLDYTRCTIPITYRQCNIHKYIFENEEKQACPIMFVDGFNFLSVLLDIYGRHFSSWQLIEARSWDVGSYDPDQGYLLGAKCHFGTAPFISHITC